MFLFEMGLLYLSVLEFWLVLVYLYLLLYYSACLYLLVYLYLLLYYSVCLYLLVYLYLLVLRLIEELRSDLTLSEEFLREFLLESRLLH